MAQAATQRASLLGLVAACSAIVVATSERVDWFRTRWWLPSRRVTFVPVFANIVPTGRTGERTVPGRVGLFSFATDGLAMEVAVDALAEVSRQVEKAHLALIGSPGPNSSAGKRWRERAQDVGCPLVFTGVAEADEISRHLSACELIIFPDQGGASSRKTSLAASLAHGQAVVALDGPSTWRDFVDAEALLVVQPTREALAEAVCRLLEDQDARAAVGAQARSFYQERLSIGRAAKTLACVVEEAVALHKGRC